MIPLVFRAGAHRSGILVSQIAAGSLRGCTKSFQNPIGISSSLLQSLVRPASAAAVSTESNKISKNYATHWRMERLLDVALLPLLPIAFFTDNVVANYLLIVIVTAHTHWGMEAIMVDYMRPRVVGKAGYYGSLGVVYILSIATMAGLLYLNYTQMPPTKAIKKLWSL